MVSSITSAATWSSVRAAAAGDQLRLPEIGKPVHVVNGKGQLIPLAKARLTLLDEPKHISWARFNWTAGNGQDRT